MIFAGLHFAQLAALFGAAGAVIVALYILKLRRRAVAIPFSPLWQRILRDKEATSLFSKLKRLLSLLLQLALLAALVLALGDPRAATSLVKGRTVVLLVDASASMQAVDVAPAYASRLGAAKAEAKTIVRGLGGADRMIVAQMDAMVTALGPMTGDTSELEREVDEIRPTDTRADFPRALRFATDALRGADDPQVIVVSDGALGPASDAAGAVHLGEAKISFVPVGKGHRNVGVTAFSVRRYPLDKSRYEVMLEVTNTGDEPEEVEISLLGDGQLVDLTKLRLNPGERLPRFYPNLSGASRTLEAKLAVAGGHDDLPADDHAYALLPERRRAKVLVVSEGNLYLQAALLLDEYLDVTTVTPKEYAKTYAAGAADTTDVVIFDRVTPAELPKAHALYLDPRGPGAPVKVGDEIADPGFDKLDRKHPIVRFTALDDVNIAPKGAHALKGEPGDKVVAASEPGGAILVAGMRAGYKFVALGFDPARSDLPLRTAWPLFLLDTINWFDDEDASYLSSFRTGDVWRVPAAAGATAATLKLPGGEAVPVPIHEGRAVYLGEHAGFYELTFGGAGQGEGKTAFAANLLDAGESAIAPVTYLVVDGKTATAPSGFHIGVRREIWIYLLLVAAVITAIEWATYHRRVTV